jgi:hypothetical protein
MINQRPLINFTRCTRLLERIDEVRRFRAPRDTDLLPSPPPEKKRRRPGSSSASAAAAATNAAFAWVERELEDAPGVISREYFETRVAALAKVEREMRDNRELELRALGFDTTPRNRKSPSGSHTSARSP